MKIIVTGATGMVGSEVIRQALEDKDIEQVTAIVRKPLDITHTKLRTLLHNDFTNYTGLEQVFRSNDCCLWCLGISQNGISEAKYIEITYDYAVAGARAMLAANAQMEFVFLSGEGAKTSEQSRVLFGRIKGKTENALLRMPFKKIFIARPAGILPVHTSGKLAFTLRMQYALVRAMKYLMPHYVIASDKLARMLIDVAKNGAQQTILTFRDIDDRASRL